jgi:hypothetical protein
MQHGPVRLVSALLGALVLIAALAACSGGDDGGGKATDDTSNAGAGDGGGASEARAANEGIDGVLAIRIESANHTTGTVDYDRHPPAGGDHNPTPAPCGFYSQAIPDEYVVHTMEHGGVWLAYAPGLGADDLATLRAEVAANRDTIATPYSGLKSGVAVVVTAWSRQLTLDSVDDPRLDEFVQKYQNASTAPEASVDCPQLPAGSGG